MHLQVDASLALIDDFADVNPDVVCNIVAQCFAAISRDEDQAISAMRAEQLARVRLEAYRSNPRPVTSR